MSNYSLLYVSTLSYISTESDIGDEKSAFARLLYLLEKKRGCLIWSMK